MLHDDAIESDPIDRLISDGLWLVVERDDGGRLRARAVPRKSPDEPPEPDPGEGSR